MKQADSNRLIAEFMGYDITCIVDELPTDKDGNYTTEGGKWVWINELQYNHNWHHLMPVVEKIEDIECEEVSTDIVGHHLFDVEIRQNVCIIHGTDIEESFGSKLHCVYNAVVSFIRWYNAI